MLIGQEKLQHLTQFMPVIAQAETRLFNYAVLIAIVELSPLHPGAK